MTQPPQSALSARYSCLAFPPCFPVCCVVLFQSRLCHISLKPVFHGACFAPNPLQNTLHGKRALQASFNLRFGLPLLLVPGMSTSSILLTACSSFILLTWPYHFRRFSVYFLERLQRITHENLRLKSDYLCRAYLSIVWSSLSMRGPMALLPSERSHKLH